MHPILSLVFGLACAALGGELFVRGAVGLARWARIPAGIVGATVAAFATSSPELSVAVGSARAGTPQIALGDGLGSNVVNVGLILGLALLFGPIKGGEGSLRRDLPVALSAPVLTAVLLFDGTLSHNDGLILLAAFLLWLVLTVLDARKERSAATEVLSDSPRWQAIAFSLVGLALLVLAGSLIVDGAKFVGSLLGWSTFVTGAILVSIGTSAPELATTIVSRFRGHDEIGLGTVLGSNVFNGLFIV
ncbi:MAG: sodium:calcium antiporter, partial [Myxococcales bacterium]